MFVITPTSGRAILASSAIWPRPRMASSVTTTSRLRVDLEERQRHADLVVEVPGRRDGRRQRQQSAARMSLVEVLPALPVMATTRAGTRPRTWPARRPSAASPRRRRSCAARWAGAPRSRRARPRRPRRPSSAAAANGRRRSARRAARRTGRPRATARLSVQTRSTTGLAARRPRGGRRRRRRPRQGQRIRSAAHARDSPAAAASASPPRPQRLAGDLAVVEGDLLVADDLPALVPLAGDQDDVAGARLVHGEADGRAAIGLDTMVALAGARRRRISSMMASGSSLRGLSEVTTARSARREATSPISGRLPRSRSPPQPKTHEQAARG